MQVMGYPIRQFANNPYAIKISQTIAISVHLQSHQDQISIDNKWKLA